MRRGLTGLAAALLVAMPFAGGADEGASQGLVGFTDGRGIAGIAGRAGDAVAGAIVFEGRPATLECVEMVPGRDETHTVYARYGDGTRGGAKVYMQIANHVQGSPAAPAGFSRTGSGAAGCGAADVGFTLVLTMFCSTHGSILGDLPPDRL